jgi:hypothetical protein
MDLRKREDRKTEEELIFLGEGFLIRVIVLMRGEYELVNNCILSRKSCVMKRHAIASDVIEGTHLHGPCCSQNIGF